MKTRSFALSAVCLFLGASALSGPSAFAAQAQDADEFDTIPDLPPAPAPSVAPPAQKGGQTAQAPAATSQAQAQAPKEEYRVGITHFAIRPSAGAIFYNGNEQFAGGALLDFNFLNAPNMKFGVATGALYSSTSGAGFFSGISTSNDSYIVQVPANLKVTFAPDRAARIQLGAHGGANVIYSSAGNATAIGEPAETGTSWDVHPNVGGDVDFALGTNVDISLRPDVTFLSSFNVVTTTLGLALKL